MRGLLYSIREGIEGFRRAPLSSLLSVSTVALALTLLGVFMAVSLNLSRLAAQIQRRMTFEVFLDETLSPSATAALEQQIKAIPGVGLVEYVSKEAAVKAIQDEFGPEVLEMLGENPLPASFRVALAPQGRGTALAEAVAAQLRGLKGVSEVVYRAELFQLLDRYLKLAMTIDVVVGVGLACGAILVIFNTIRLIIHAKEQNIEIMKLVGATPSFIRRPFLVEGILQGGAGGALAALAVWLLARVVALEAPRLIVLPHVFYLALWCAGMALGWLGSLVAVRRLVKY
ncbi:MAG: ABC transporter permease [candidate division KSB1 bacterium]|nr:ABC transporter permease [candidate division KSB1 bacterium]MDZ7385219.1 ABC transporter permease [candidate division KSB1 bacterium]MDZ7392335.1 ABC transporter permease [candidate division KSB1 bacterium]MDZ7412521.1 ABC transporter permease [candidate division KSB1 bacterium]